MADKPAPSNRSDLDSAAALAGEFIRSGAFGVQSTVNGILQNFNHIGLGKLVPEVTLISAPEAAPAGTLAWHAQVAGQGIATGLEFLGARYLAGTLGAIPKAFATSLSPDSLAVGRIASNGLSNGLTGLGLEGLTSNVQTSSDADFWTRRAVNGLSGAVTFGVLGATARGVGELGGTAGSYGYAATASFLRNPFTGNVAGSILAGGLNADITTRLETGKPAQWGDIGKGAYEYAFAGLVLGALAPQSISEGTSTARRPTEPAPEAAADGAPRPVLLLEAPLLPTPTASRLTGERRVAENTEREGAALQNEINSYAQPNTRGFPNLFRQSGVRVVAFGENHLPQENPFRDAITDALPQAKSQGFSIMAQEMPMSWQPLLDDFIRTGEFHPEAHAEAVNVERFKEKVLDIDPVRKQLEAAQRLGMRIVAVDEPRLDFQDVIDDAQRRLQLASRDENMAARLNAILDTDPSNKIVFVGGSEHTRTEYGTAAPTLVTRLKESPDETGRPRIHQVVGVASETDTDLSGVNLAPLAANMHKAAIIPTAKAPTLAGLTIWKFPDKNGKLPTIGQWDYLSLFPEKPMEWRDWLFSKHKL